VVPKEGDHVKSWVVDAGGLVGVGSVFEPLLVEDLLANVLGEPELVEFVADIVDIVGFVVDVGCSQRAMLVDGVFDTEHRIDQPLDIGAVDLGSSIYWPIASPWRSNMAAASGSLPAVPRSLRGRTSCC